MRGPAIPADVRALAKGDNLAWPIDRDRVLELIMADPGLVGLDWLLAAAEIPHLRAWLRDRKGRPLSGRLLAFWCSLVEIPAAEWQPWDTHMASMPSLARLPAAQIPEYFADLFWDYTLSQITWPEQIHLVMNRVLQYGDERQQRWLLETAGTDFVRDWFLWTEGKPLGGPALYRWGERLGVDKETLELWDSHRLFKVG